MSKTNRYNGSVLFNGNLTVTISGEKKVLQIDYLGKDIKKADPNREVIVMLKKNIGYNELDTGYVVIGQEKDEYSFGLKVTPTSRNWGVHSFGDVIAWGYVDQEEKTPQPSAENVEEKRREVLDKVGDGPCKNVQLKVRWKDDNVQLGMEIDKGQIKDYARATVKYGPECLSAFLDFHNKHPEIVEAHFFTELTKWEEDEDAAE